MDDELDLDYVATVRADDFDDRDRRYPPAPLRGDDAYRKPHELFLDALFAEEIEPPARVDFDLYRRVADPARHQKGEECTGFALAAIADFHQRKGLSAAEFAGLDHDGRAAVTASRRMLYEMAQIYDGVAFAEGSTLRGALKGWRRQGVASDLLWPYDPDDEHGEKHGRLTMERLVDAVARPGGFYYRIDPGETAKIKDALARGFPLYASALLHAGWYRLFLPGNDHVIPYEQGDTEIGGHAIVLVGYDEEGIWIHNSWGPRWGDEGFARIRWEDWAEWGREVWFVVPPPPPSRIDVTDLADVPAAPADPRRDLAEMWRHVVTIGDDGRLATTGRYALDAPTVATLLYMFAEHTEAWPQRRLAVFADGGYWATPTVVEQLRPLRDRLMAEHVYPIFLLWQHPWFESVLPWLHGEPGLESLAGADVADFWSRNGGTTMANVLLAESVAPRAWGEMIDRSCHARGRTDGAARVVAKYANRKWNQALEGKVEPFDVHLLAHGTGVYLLAELLALLEMPVASCDLWAPAMIGDDFAATIGSRTAAGQVGHVTIRGLTDEAERADRVGPVPGSVLSAASAVLTVAGLDLDRAIVTTAGDGPPEWGVIPRAVVGMERFWGVPAVAELAAAGRLSTWTTAGSHTGLVTDGSLHAAAIADIVRRSRGGAGPGRPPADGIRDPLARAIADLRPSVD